MMHLYLIRHGIAVDREDPHCPPDTERPLTPKGMKRSHAAALGLRALDVKPNAVLTSPMAARPANRRNFLRNDRLSVQENHSHGRPEGHQRSRPNLLRELQSMKAKVVLCFGHEPHSAPRDRPRPPHQRENHGTQESGPRAFGIGARLAAARALARSLPRQHPTPSRKIGIPSNLNVLRGLRL